MAFRPDHEMHKRRFGRNLGVGLALALFIAIIFGLTVVKVTEIGKVDGFEKAIPTSEPMNAPTAESVAREKAK